MVKRAYRVLLINRANLSGCKVGSVQAAERELNALGEQGWKVVAFFVTNTFWHWTLERVEEPGALR